MKHGVARKQQGGHDPERIRVKHNEPKKQNVHINTNLVIIYATSTRVDTTLSLRAAHVAQSSVHRARVHHVLVQGLCTEGRASEPPPPLLHGSHASPRFSRAVYTHSITSFISFISISECLVTTSIGITSLRNLARSS